MQCGVCNDKTSSFKDFRKTETFFFQNFFRKISLYAYNSVTKESTLIVIIRGKPSLRNFHFFPNAKAKSRRAQI
jgi:hypothetical protein